MTDSTQTYHVPVLLQESIGGLAIHEGGVYVDVTFGGGGHSREILRQLHGTGHLYSFDQDADAEANIGTEAEDNFTFVRSNFRYLKTGCATTAWTISTVYWPTWGSAPTISTTRSGDSPSASTRRWT